MVESAGPFAFHHQAVPFDFHLQKEFKGRGGGAFDGPGLSNDEYSHLGYCYNLQQLGQAAPALHPCGETLGKLAAFLRVRARVSS